MKMLSLICISLFTCMASFGQTKAVQKAVIKAPTLQCDMCKENIETRLGKEYGVSTVRVDYRRKTITVSWLTDRTNLETIKDVISVMGYDADDVPADPIGYAKLPKCCKKPEAKKTEVKKS